MMKATKHRHGDDVFRIAACLARRWNWYALSQPLVRSGGAEVAEAVFVKHGLQLPLTKNDIECGLVLEEFLAEAQGIVHNPGDQLQVE